MSKDAAAARREARKRKILENSASRLTKIVGKSEATTDSDTVPKYSDQRTKLDSCNGIAFHGENDFFKVLDEKSSFISSNVFEEEKDHDIDEPVKAKSFPAGKEEIMRNRIAGKEEAPASADTAYQEVFWCFFHGFMGIMIRLMYEINMSVLFADSIFMPFATMSLAKYMSDPAYFMKPRQNGGGGGGGLARLALLMSGIPQNLLNNIFLAQQILFNVGYDFALFFFAFAISHLFLLIFVTR